MQAMFYDQQPYPHLTHAVTHPDRLAVLATLMGLEPPDVATCRVLELGCGTGWNSIVMAEGLPSATFLGIDNVAVHIDAGQAAIAALDLHNVELHNVNILELSADIGMFDYIIAHGVYSWVEPAVRDRILAICANHLAPNGIAYISYNTDPGWHGLRMIREMLRYHTRGLTDTHAIAARVAEFLTMIEQVVPEQNAAFGQFLHHYLQFLKKKQQSFGYDDWTFLLYDELAEINEPVTVSAFIEHAARHGIAYLTDSDPSATLAQVGEDAAQWLSNLSISRIEQEQYLDFLRCRTFRETLLCRAGVAHMPTFSANALRGLFAAANVTSASPATHYTRNGVVEFRATDDARITIAHPASIAAFEQLAAAWPCALPVNDLATTESDAHIVRTHLLRGFCCSTNLVRFSTCTPTLVRNPGTFPNVPASVRMQAQRSTTVTNGYHEPVPLTLIQRQVVRTLNGERDRSRMLGILEGTSESALEEYLVWCGQHALLIG